jgi:acyl-CoA synthetase (NDP forming)
VRALAHVARYAAWRREPLGRFPDLPNVDAATARRIVGSRGKVDDLLAAYGVSVVPTREASEEARVFAAADEVGYPVVVKAAEARLRHRPDLGAVRLDVADAAALGRTYAEIARTFGPRVLVQPMVPPGVACVVELFDHPAFGPVVGFGLGGVATELLGDRAWRTAPLTDADAAALVRSPRAAALLQGYRGSTPVDEAALADLVMRLGRVADEQPEVKRLVLNPVLAHASGLSVVHAMLDVGDATARPDTGPRRLR